MSISKLENLFKADVLGNLALGALLPNIKIAVDVSGKQSLIAINDCSAAQLAAAYGVGIIDDGRILIVAKDFSSRPMASTNKSIVASISQEEAIRDYNGKAHTATLLADSASNGAEYAAHYCNSYSAGSKQAGEWWLPSAGEALLIAKHKAALNYALNLIGGSGIGSTYAGISTSNQYNSSRLVAMVDQCRFADMPMSASRECRPVTSLY